MFLLQLHVRSSVMFAVDRTRLLWASTADLMLGMQLYLDTVFVEDLVELVLTWELFLYQVQVLPYVRRGVLLNSGLNQMTFLFLCLALLVCCGGFVFKSVIVSRISGELLRKTVLLV